ncbi:MAG: 30S ribosomal protein S17 [Thermoplasmata archaeon]
MSNKEVRDIGVDVVPPEEKCEDRNCPYHGTLPVRGQILSGVVESTKMDGSAVIRRDYLQPISKYERYEKRRSHYSAHLPPCIEVEIGDKVRIMECRPLSKSVSYVVIERGGEG